MFAKIHRLGALLMILSGCSLAMRGVDPAWDKKQEPICSDSYAPVAVDGLTASAVIGLVSELAKEPDIKLDTSIVVGAVAVSLLYTVSAGVGASRYNDCRVARAEWYANEAIREIGVPADDEPSAPSVADAPSAPSPRAPGTPRASSAPAVAMTSAKPATATVSEGYFCTRAPSHPGLVTCRRGLAACQQARELLATPDSGDCIPRKSVWCFIAADRSRCFTTQHTCEAQMATGTTASSPCAERP
jgi:hypothetical protein